MPAVRVFIDTNTLLYLHDRDGGEKAETAIHWVRALTARQIARINLQVLNEMTFVMLRKRWFANPEHVFSIVDQLTEIGSSPLSAATCASARHLHLRYRYSWWDCLLLASALELGCTHFLSEDLQDGQSIEGLTIIDPFAHSPEQILISR
ncbi:PIN domain-containing protein [Mesorhizobium sp. ASY16-5R]|uniref:PIN domain-containing protein n=1 Tax=Mesorhizobium sp. ASY16-5R TaxID=3445772 RepID=UPI003FA03BA6